MDNILSVSLSGPSKVNVHALLYSVFSFPLKFHMLFCCPLVFALKTTSKTCSVPTLPSAVHLFANTFKSYPFPPRYDSEGRLTNVTYPTGMVTSLHREIERSINIDIESSSRDDDVTVITNLSSVEASYTVVQGAPIKRSSRNSLFLSSD